MSAKLKAIVFKEACAHLVAGHGFDGDYGYACWAIQNACDARALPFRRYVDAFVKVFKPRAVVREFDGFVGPFWDGAGYQLEPRYMALLLMYHMVKDKAL